MSSGRTCSECGAPIPTDSPQGFCAQCLFALGLQSTDYTSPQKSEVHSQERGIASVSDQSGDRIGHYRILQEIGHGGCGVVYMAEQEEPVRRKVALKVIKLGMDTRQVVARFEAERQALALMDHPNIAKVLDAGATDAGRPYFVMELVGGIKITDYCQQNNLTTRQRLDLFIQVCRAIQHAHQKGIIHRDIKPSNVLVAMQDGVPTPKVIDFGIAKATQGRLTDETLFTAFEQFLGTPAYMSPEQAQLGGLDVDTRSDIYSLGVLLYELLTGRTPFDTKELIAAGLDEMRRTIREVEPVKPSTRLTQERLPAPGKASALSTPSSQLSTDLDWIVMKCLEKDRSRRYETANGLATDIGRHLNNEPVIARPPSKLYEVQKTFRRHKFGFTAAAAIMMVLIMGVLASSLQAVRATRAEHEQSRLREKAQAAQANEVREREKAQTAAAKSQQIAEFLKEMLKGVGPSKALGRDTTMLKEILDNTADRVGRDLTNQPAVEAELRLTIADAYFQLGELAKAEAMAQASLQLAKSAFGETNASVADALNKLAAILGSRNASGDLVKAERLAREALAMRTNLLGEENPDVASSLAVLAGVLNLERKLEESVAINRKALALRRKLQENHPDVATALNNLGYALSRQGNQEAARLALVEALEIQRKSYGGDNHPEIIWSLTSLSRVLEMQGKLADAEKLCRDALELSKKLLPPEHPGKWSTMDILARVLRDEGKLDEAESVTRELLAAKRKVYDDEHPSVAQTLGILRDVTVSPDGAEARYREDVERLKREGANQKHLANALKKLAYELKKAGKRTEAEAVSREELELWIKLDGKESTGVAVAMLDLSMMHFEDREYTQAESLAREALSIQRKLLDQGHPKIGNSAYRLARALHQQGKFSEAEPHYREALDISQKAKSPRDEFSPRFYLAGLLDDMGRFAEAEEHYREATGLSKALGNGKEGDSLLGWARALRMQGKDAGVAERELVARGTPQQLNSLAWLLATSTESRIRDGSNAVLYAAKAVALSQRKLPQILDTLAAAHAEIGQFADAVRVQREAVALLTNGTDRISYNSRVKLYESERPFRDDNQQALQISRLLDAGEFPKAEQIARECLTTRENQSPNDWRTFNARVLLGGALLGQMKYPEAELFLVSGYQGMREREDQIPTTAKARLREALQRLVQLYGATGRPDQSSEWKQRLAEFERAQ